ncbi:MAG: hypothetical protein PHC84_02085 [Clostridia bacterium]|nr:hypothetical protein [Clostridia bacterium]
MQFYLRNDYIPKVSRYSYPVKSFAGIDALSEQETLPLAYCSYGYNIGFRNGALINGIGIDNAVINNSALPGTGAFGKRIVRCWIYYKYNYTLRQREDEIVVLCDDGAVYTTLLDGGTAFTQTTMSFSGATASAINYHYNGEDILLLFGSSGGMYVYNGATAVFYANVPGFTSVCLHYERIYGTTGYGFNRVYFSDDLNPTNWNVSLTEAGYISFPDEGGRVGKVLSFNDYVFIFRDYGIHRLTAYTDLTEYKLTKVFSTANRIYPDTVQICGDRIIFVAEDGFYSFDGYTAKKVFSQLFPLIDGKKHAVSCYFNYKYYLSATLKTDGQTVGDEDEGNMKNNGMIILDLDLSDVSVFRGGDVGSFLPVNVGDICALLVTFNNYRSSRLGLVSESGRLFEKPLLKLWRSPKTGFSQLSGDKVLRRIYLTANQPLSVTVCGECEKQRQVYSSPQVQLLPVNDKASAFSVSIATISDSLYLSGLLMEFDIIKRRYA